MPMILRTVRLVLLSALLASALMLSADGALANHSDNHVTGPQPVSNAACNDGTVNARGNLPADHPARDAVPHIHDFNGPQCYHANPTYPPQP
jgi:hypothetical protein